MPWSIFKRFSRALSWAQTSHFWRVGHYGFLKILISISDFAVVTASTTTTTTTTTVDIFAGKVRGEFCEQDISNLNSLWEYCKSVANGGCFNNGCDFMCGDCDPGGDAGVSLEIHSSEIRGLCLMKWPSEMLQNLSYLYGIWKST